MKKSIAMLLALLLCAGLVGCQVAQAPQAAETETAEPSDGAVATDAIVAKVGDETISLQEYQELFDTYSYYYSMFGYNVTSDEATLKGFQDDILNSLLQNAVIKYQVKQHGINTLDEAQEAAAKKNAEETMQGRYDEYRNMAVQELENDPTLDQDAYVNSMILEEAAYYTGKDDATAEDYAAWLLEDARQSALVDELRTSVLADIAVDDAQVSAWYDETLAAQTETYTSDPGAYKNDQETYESSNAGTAAPVLFTPEGYYRIMDMLVKPRGNVSADNEGYDEKIAQADELQSEYGTLAFADAAAGKKENAARMSEILKEYKALKDETDAMELKAEQESKAIIDEAYGKLQAGATFASLLPDYTENDVLLGSEALMKSGMLIDPALKEGWSEEVCAAFAKLQPGEYSPVFHDADGYHIVYCVGAEPVGARPLAEVQENAKAFLLTQAQDTEWETLMTEWTKDDSVEIFEDVYRSVGSLSQG